MVFVYNADSGFFNALTDTAHKIFSPQTYECNLCALTYGNFYMNGEWKTFLESLKVNREFLHRDELLKQYQLKDVELPAIFFKNNGNLELAIAANKINDCQNLDELKRLIQTTLER